MGLVDKVARAKQLCQLLAKGTELTAAPTWHSGLKPLVE